MLRAFAAVIQSALDIILPRKERVIRSERYSQEDIPVVPQEHDACGVRITTLTRYREKAVEDLVKALKYDRADGAARLLARILAEYLREEIANMKLFSAKPVVLIPMPLHASRESERGFNQVMKILENLPEEFKDGTLSRIESGLLIRTRATPQQTRLSRGERLKNVAGAFALAKQPDDAHHILIDDVTTTGATLTEASKLLLNNVTLLALARA